MKIKARIYGTADKAGTFKEFEVVESLPEAGERVHLGDPGYIWGKAEPVRLDPEQGGGDDDIHTDYNFFRVYEIDTDTGEEAEAHYIAVANDSLRYYIIGTDGNVHGESDTMQGCADLLDTITEKMTAEHGADYVESLELEIIADR